MSRRTLSGQRKKTVAAAGNGAGTVTLKCGHAAAGDPVLHHASKRKDFWLCPDGCGFQEARAA